MKTMKEVVEELLTKGGGVVKGRLPGEDTKVLVGTQHKAGVSIEAFDLAERIIQEGGTMIEGDDLNELREALRLMGYTLNVVLKDKVLYVNALPIN